MKVDMFSSNGGCGLFGIVRMSKRIVGPATLGVLIALTFAFTLVDPGLSITSSVASPRWKRVPMPVPLESHRAVAVQVGGSEFLYVIGGKASGTSISNKVYFAQLNPDGPLDGWTSTLSIHHTPGLQGHSAVAVGGRIYVLGGRGNSWDTFSSVYCARPDTMGRISDWIPVASMPVGLTLHAAVAVDNVIFVMGGYSSQRKGFIREVWAADITGGGCSSLQWRPHPEESLPCALAALSAAAVRPDNGRKFIYVIGGYDGNAHKQVWHAEVDSSGKLEPWGSLGDLSLAPSGFFRHVSAISGRYLYVIGGTRTGYDWLNAVYRARIRNDGSLEAWSALDAFPVSVFNHAAAVSAPGRMYVLGGNAGSGVWNWGYYTPLLAFEKSASPTGPVTFGDTINYTLALTNLGVRDTEDLIITDIVQTSVPTTLELHNLPGECHIHSGDDSTVTSVCTVSSLTLGETKDLNFQVAILQPAMPLVSALSPHQAPRGGGAVSAVAPVDYFLPSAEVVGPSIRDQIEWDHVSTSRWKPGDDADLRLEKSGDQTLVVAGQVLSYTLSVYNGGPSTAQDVVVMDSLPDGVTFKSATPPPNSTSPLTWSLDSIIAGGEREIQLAVQVAPGTSGTILNTALANSSTPDTNTDNNQDQVWTVVVKRADLRIEKTDNPDPGMPGKTLTYTLLVTNGGPSDAQAVSVLDILPSELEVITTTPSPVDGPNPLQWRLDLSAGQSQEIQIVATVDPDSTGTIRNVAIVTSDIDPFLSNNEDEEWTVIGSSPAPVPVINRAYLGENGLWCCKETIFINASGIYLPIILKDSS